MPEHFRALVVILVLAGVVYALARRPACEWAMAEHDFVRRRNLWFGITLIAFFAHSFWVFMAVTAALLLYVRRREANIVALFVWLMFAVPPFGAQLSGLGVINQLLELNYLRVLSLVLLVPAYFRLRQGSRWTLPDVLIAGYLLIQLGLQLSVDSATNTARYGLYALLDMVLPYYVASRSLRDIRAFREMAMCFVVVAMVMSAIAIFETARGWLLYSALDRTLDVHWGYGNYLARSGSVRAQVSTGQPIALGYVIAVAIGLYLYVGQTVSDRTRRWIGHALLFGGLVASLSRGPWVGALVAVIGYRVAGPKLIGGTLKALLWGGAVVGVVLLSPWGAQVVDHLPFVGTVDEFNIDYRRQLMDLSIAMIAQEPWFGVSQFYYRLADQGMVAGGMVDVVNTYIGVALSNGVIALTCFMGAFAVVMWRMYRTMRWFAEPGDERRALGCGLMAALLCTVVTIATTSSVSVIPFVYWTLLGAGWGYVRFLEEEMVAASQALEPEPAPRPRDGYRRGRGVLGAR